MTDNPFAPDVVDAVASHMNEDHDDDSLLIVRALAGVTDATEATVSYLDGQGVDFAVVVGEDERTVRVPWSRPITERPEIRQEFVQMYRQAAEAAGDPPRQATQH